jgi:hypothetical protein
MIPSGIRSGSTSILFLILVLFAGCRPSGDRNAPVQPIAFRHDIHARDHGIPCLYCHAYARQSPVAGVPSVKKCMVCHMFYAGDDEGVKTLKEYWENGEGIEWVRIHSLPDYVYFSHKRHVRGGVECRECHGAVEEMETVVRVSSLEMGWCLDCHRERGAGDDCLICHK